MKKHLAFGVVVLLLAGSSLAHSASPTALDVENIHKAAANAKSLFLGEPSRIQAVDSFMRLVSIKGPSGLEQPVKEELLRTLTQAGAVVVSTQTDDPTAPCNLIMEIPGSGDLAGRPSVLLNAHTDTIERSAPEFLAFDESTGDFYHLHESDSQKSSSFGGDDRSAVAVIVEAVRLLQANQWARGVAHRRILLVFTAEEEQGLLGAKYLSLHEPALFASLEISLSIDGPLDFRSNYPRDSFVAVVSESDSVIMPYKHVLELMQEFCGRSGTRFGRTEIGLGMGDFSCFPASAHAGLHLRSPVRGFHRTERLNVQDLINHIDLLCYSLLGWDHSPPANISPQTSAGGTDEKSR